ncbi:MAG: hypothetical protein AB7O39_03160 [Flavobacteriaceae bacterium]
MTDKLSLYNGALLHLDEEPLASLSETGNKKKKLDAAYDSVFRWCLEQGFWNFALRAVTLEPSDSLTSEFGYSLVFEKPDDWIRTAAMSADEYGRIPLLNYEDRKDYWLADIEPIYLWYVSNDADYGADLGKWPESYVNFFQYALAHRICGAVTGGQSRKQELLEMMMRAKRDASNKDGMNQPATRFPPSGRLVASRGGSGLGSREGRYRAG